MPLKIIAALPLVLAACAAPAVLPETRNMGLGASDVSAPRSHAVVANLFPDYTPRAVTRPEDWRRLNDAQAPGGALR